MFILMNMMKWSKAMKKSIIPAAILVAAAISCSKENVVPQVSEEEPVVLMHIEITASKAATRTVLVDAEEGSVHWSDGDEISVFDTDAACTGHRFSSTINASNPTTASFNGDVHQGTTSIRALYPYNADARISGNVITTTLPSTQQATSGSFANGAALAVASGTVNEQGIAEGMIFNNLCAVIAFKTPSYLNDARNVVIASKSGTTMAGSVSIDCSTSAITSVNGSSSVTIGVNSLDSSSTYFAAIAPGTYTNGFTFTVTTQGGNTYTAQTTQTLQAAAGGIYMLGTVGLVLTGYTPSVTLTHSYSSGVLTGTDAVVSIPNLSAELASMASWTIQLKNSNDVLVRSLTSSSGTMTVENGYTYLPQGTYYLTTTYSLNNNGSIKTRQLPDNTAVSPAPTVSVTLGGYTSYDCYKGTNGQSASAATANSKNGSSIYDLSVTVNIHPDILHDSKYPAGSGSYRFNSGNQNALNFPSGSNTHSLGTFNNQSWRTHTLDATFTFDGVTANAARRSLHVTGLPWSDSAPGTNSNGFWSWGESCEKDGNSIRAGAILPSNNTEEKLRVTTGSFYCPADITVSLSTNVKIRTATRINRNSVTIKVGGQEVVTQQGPTGTSVDETYNISKNGTLTTSDSKLSYHPATGRVANNYVWVNSASITYR